MDQIIFLTFHRICKKMNHITEVLWSIHTNRKLICWY